MTNIVLPKKRLSRKTAISSQIYTYLRGLITSTEIKPGSSFSENDLSEHFKVSRQPVREALNELQHDDLITIIPQKGTVVKKISGSKLRQVVFIRATLECGSLDNIEYLPERKFNGIMRKLKQNINDQYDCVNNGENEKQFFMLDDKFHEIICAFSDVPLTWQAIQSYKGQLDRIRYLSNKQDSPTLELVKEHEKIYDLLLEHDIANAKMILGTHLHLVLSTYETIKSHYSQWFEDEEDEDEGITLSDL